MKVKFDKDNVYIPDEELQEGMWNIDGKTYMTFDAANKYAESIPGKRLPTKKDFDALARCDYVFDIESKCMIFKVDGMDVSFPAAGFRYDRDDSFYGAGVDGYYWSATPINSYGFYLYFNHSGTINPSNYYSRSNGFSVRLVSDVNTGDSIKNKTIIK